jgi:uncharacterized membrane protein
MSQADLDRLTRLERRVADLEQRLGATAAQLEPEPPAPPAVAPTMVAAAASPAAQPAPPTSAHPAPLTLAPAAPPTLAPAAPPTRVPAAAAAPRPPRSFADLEEQLSSRLLAWVGGIALVLGAMFFLSLAFSRGWIGPEARVLIGLVAGAVALAAGAWLFDRGDRTPATVLTGVGVGTGSLALFAASRLYGFIPIEAALVGFLVLAVTTAAIALRASSQAVAAFGIVATTLAPPVLGASPNLATIAFLGAALVGTALIGFGRSWPWLTLIAFLATAPQAARWFGDEPSTTLAIVGIFSFWTINTLAANGRALVGTLRTVHRANAILLVLNSLFAIASLRSILPDDPLLRSASLAVLAGAQGVLALELLLRQPRRHPFGVLAAGLAVGTLAIGMAMELGGIARPIGLTALAVVVAWVAIRFRDRVAAAWAGAIGSLALADFLLVQYPTSSFGRIRPDGWPFGSPEGIAAIVMAAAMLIITVVAWRSFTVAPFRNPGWTAPLVLAGGALGAIALIAYAAAFELWADMLVAAWAGLGVVALSLAAFVRRDGRAWSLAALGGSGLLAVAAFVALAIVVPATRLFVDPGHHGPLRLVVGTTFGVASLAALAAALAGVGWLLHRWPPTAVFRTRHDAAVVAAAAVMCAGAVAMYLVSVVIVDAFQARVGIAGDPRETATQAQVVLSIVWVLAGAGAFAAGLIRGIGPARMFGLGLLSLAAAKVFLFDLAALDVAYRVLSLIGLGGVLLASSFVANRFRSNQPTAGRAQPIEEATQDATATTDAGGG